MMVRTLNSEIPKTKWKTIWKENQSNWSRNESPSIQRKAYVLVQWWNGASTIHCRTSHCKSTWMWAHLFGSRVAWWNFHLDRKIYGTFFLALSICNLIKRIEIIKYSICEFESSCHASKSTIIDEWKLTPANKSSGKQYQWPLRFGTRTCNVDKNSSRSLVSPLFHNDPLADPTCYQIWYLKKHEKFKTKW